MILGQSFLQGQSYNMAILNAKDKYTPRNNAWVKTPVWSIIPIQVTCER